MVLNFVLGTAAELIKVYPIMLRSLEKGLEVHVLATGQSRENLTMQYQDFGWDPKQITWLLPNTGDLESSSSALKWFLRAMWATRHSHAHALLRNGPVIVHGDTLSTLIGAWLGKRLSLPVVHVEAGLRSPNLFNPFPEEINRRLVSRLADLHMAPDAQAEKNLLLAGVKGKVICTQGNTLMDTVRMIAPTHTKITPLEKPYAVANVHRYENLNNTTRWNKIVETLVIAAKNEKVIMVLHPQTRHRLQTDQSAKKRLEEAGVELRERMPFSAFITLLKSSSFLISDGGSNQEECSYLGKPCLLLRLETERREGLDSCCVLSRFEDQTIAEFLKRPQTFARPVDPSQVSPTEVILNHLHRS